MSDELTNENFMEDAAKAVQDEPDEPEISTVDEDGFSKDLTEDGSEGEVPEASFFKENKKEEDISETKLETEVDAPDSNQTIMDTYKVDGKDFEIDFNTPEGREKAKKALSMEGGARRRISKLAATAQKAIKLEKEQGELLKYKDNWDKLEKYKDDLPQLFEAITQKKYDDFIQGEFDKKLRYQDANEEERRVIDQDDALRKMQVAESRRELDHQKRKEELEKREEEIEVNQMENKMQPIFRKYAKFENYGHTLATANSLREILWQSTMSKLGQVKDKYDISDPKVIELVFKSRAKALTGNATRIAEKKVDELVEGKKETARKQAQLASTRNYPKGQNMDELAKKDPVSLFQNFFGN